MPLDSATVKQGFPRLTVIYRSILLLKENVQISLVFFRVRYRPRNEAHARDVFRLSWRIWKLSNKLPVFGN